MSTTQAALQFRAFIERIERLEEDRKAIADDIAEVFKELKGAGFDKDAAKTVLKVRRTDGGLAQYHERSAIVDVYLAALGMLPADEADRAPARAREIIEEFPTATQDLSAAIDNAGGIGPALSAALGVDVEIVRADPATGEITESEIPRPVPTEDEEKAGEAVSLSPASPAELNSAHEPQSSPASAEADAPCPVLGASATISDDEIPDFVKKPFARPARPLRPHCLNPGLCAGTGSKHCHSCTKALEEAGEPA